MRARHVLAAVAAVIGAAVGGFATVGPASASGWGTDVRADLFQLINTGTDQCADLSLDDPTGTAVVQQPCTEKTGGSQVWLAQPLATDPLNVQLVNQARGLCMDLLDGEFADGTPVVLARCTPKLVSQRWQILAGAVPGPLRIVNRAFGQCLEVRDGSLERGAPIQVSACAEVTAHQVWRKI
ncbi:MAG TPA: RICIN domain-containing protein [Actinophytocola sp.]|uniref:RICIN domain-containing protein n=1 Tax=Actinophytocola sp. TaxID=1872138 RepID=UPI002DB6C66F|nr:RICIN domain-containing protein [Actinophytocola sp.]HEU5471046.1 RICIN domain-containing protein [Actinophytocola sp.]